MSENGAKKVGEVPAKASKSNDWDGMEKLLVSDVTRKEFANLRRAFDEANHQIQTKLSLEPEPIDWDYYRKGIGSRLVDVCRSKLAKSTTELRKPFASTSMQGEPFNFLRTLCGCSWWKQNSLERLIFRIGWQSGRGLTGLCHICGDI